MIFTENLLTRRLDALKKAVKKFYTTNNQQELSSLADYINDIAFEVTFDAIPSYTNPDPELFKAFADTYREAAVLIRTLVEGEEKILAKSMRDRAEFFERVACGEDASKVFRELSDGNHNDKEKIREERQIVDEYI